MNKCSCGSEAVAAFFGWELAVRQHVCHPCWVKAATASHAVTDERLKKYGITTADFAAMLAAQSFACDICRAEGELVIDHDHDSGEVRGLLCPRCNSALGLFGDMPVILDRAAVYLKRGGALSVKTLVRKKNLDRAIERSPLAIDQLEQEVLERTRSERRRAKAAKRMKFLGAKANADLIRAATSVD